MPAPGRLACARSGGVRQDGRLPRVRTLTLRCKAVQWSPLLVNAFYMEINLHMLEAVLSAWQSAAIPGGTCMTRIKTTQRILCSTILHVVDATQPCQFSNVGVVHVVNLCRQQRRDLLRAVHCYRPQRIQRALFPTKSVAPNEVGASLSTRNVPPQCSDGMPLFPTTPPNDSTHW